MAGDGVTIDGRAELQRQILPDRFEVIDEPLGWRCRACRAEVRSPLPQSSSEAVARLAESAADHALFCGRCAD
ncbi:MAG: hypothetical protein AAFO29_13755 [Actinomycetota bacterium]